jgi:seryl-tRNA(Sec) selenium transferase
MSNETCKCEGFLSRHGDLLILVLTTVSLFLWERSESRSDYRRIEDLVSSIHQEIKDFHGRLCTIEERNKEK